MKVNGIIAEYNPFHNGHLFHLTESKRLTGADYTVVVMSGNFVQRGAPALTDKFLRAKAALLGGADLVVELPVLYAVSGAEYFAAGAVSLLSRLGAVTHLCFGSESGSVAPLAQAAQILAEEPKDYRVSFKKYLRQGLSYPRARARALLERYPFLARYPDLLSSPNNLLGIEYIKALLLQKSSLVPVTLRRTGSGYHSRSDAAGSALAIRQALYAGEETSFLADNMPPEAARLLSQALTGPGPARSQDFSQALYYKLLTRQDEGFESYLDVSGALSDRIRRRLKDYDSLDGFCRLLKTREVTYTRISRCLFHILLDVRKEDMEQAREMGLTPYARVLGLRKSAGPLLRAVKTKASLSLVTKPSRASRLLPPGNAQKLLLQDIRSSQLYLGVQAQKTRTAPANEIASPLVLL